MLILTTDCISRLCGYVNRVAPGIVQKAAGHLSGCYSDLNWLLLHIHLCHVYSKHLLQSSLHTKRRRLIS